MDFEEPNLLVRSRLMDFCWNPLKKPHAVDLRQQQVRQEPEDILAEQDWNLSLGQEEPPQISEGTEELCSGPEAEQLVLKQESKVEVRWESESDEDPDHQHQLLDPDTQLHIIEVKLEDEASADREEPEPPQVKEEQLVLKHQTGTFMDTCEECDHGELEPNGHQILSHGSPVAESPDQKRIEPVESEPAGSSELNSKWRRHSNRSPSGSTREPRSECAMACVVCEVCGRAFRNKYKMKVHSRTHTGEKPHPCPVCSKTFRVSRDLTIHTRTHTGEKPYICQVCGRGFLHSGVLAVHVRTHTGEKPYICKVCGRSFRQSSTLSVHLRTHTGEKPFSCPICSKGFSRNDNRIIHMRTHTGEARGSAGPGSAGPGSAGPGSAGSGSAGTGSAGMGVVGVRSHVGLKPISCETCGRSFTHRSNLTVHLRTHTGEKPYSCARCGKTFRHHSSWSVHMRTHQNL